MMGLFLEYMRKKLAEKDGVVIVAVLWMTALIMWLALQISLESRLKGEEQVHRLRKSQAFHLALGGCYEALARMGQTSTDVFSKNENVAWLPDGKPNEVLYSTGKAVVYIEAEDDKININSVPPDTLVKILEQIGLPENEAEGLTGRILDFIDSDESQRPGGAETEAYEAGGGPVRPFNGPFLSLDQLLLVPGVTQQVFYGYDTPQGETDREWESERPPFMPTRESLFQMLTVHGNNTTLPSPEDEDFIEKVYSWQSGATYRILSCGMSSAGPPAVTIWLVVQFAPETKRGYEVLYRKIL